MHPFREPVNSQAMSDLFDLGLKLILAAFLGGAIGYERERHGQAAGFRTNIIVATAACLLMHLSNHLTDLYGHLSTASTIRIDPSRIASYTVAGMGFLGAGAIIKGKGKVKGLTTAAGLWLVNAVGLAVGMGAYRAAVLTTAISLVFLYVFRRLLRPSFVHDIYTVLTVSCRCPSERLEEISKILKRYNAEIQAVNFYYDLTQKRHTVKIRLRTTDDIPQARIIDEILLLENIERISWEEAPVP